MPSTQAIGLIPRPHEYPQPPQFIGSLLQSTHTLPHKRSPSSHSEVQKPERHPRLSGQT